MEPAKSRKPQSATTAWWDSLQPVRGDKTLGPAAKLCYGWLWWKAGSRPGGLVMTFAGLAAVLGRTHRAAMRWVEGLAERGLLHVIDRDDRTGEVHLYINAPADMARPRRIRPDPQGRLPGIGDQGPPDPDPAAVDVVSIDAARVDVLVPKRPPPQWEPTPRAPTDRSTDRTTEIEEPDWTEAERLARHAAKWVHVKPKTRFQDAYLLLTAAVLVQRKLPEAAFVDAVDRVMRDNPMNKAAYFRKCFSEEIAKHFGKPESQGPRILVALEKATRIPSRRMEHFFHSIGKDKPSEQSEPVSNPDPEDKERSIRAAAKHREEHLEVFQPTRPR